MSSGKHFHNVLCLSEAKGMDIKMRFFINIIKVLLFLGVGTALFFIPYEKFQIWFPQAPKVAVVKVAGIVSLLCGIIIMVLMLSEK